MIPVTSGRPGDGKLMADQRQNPIRQLTGHT